MVEYKRNPNTKCTVCSKPVYRRPVELTRSNHRAFCSQKCYGISCRRENPCIVCKTPILGGLHKKTCSRVCANKHRAGIKYKLGRPRDKAKGCRALKLMLFRHRGEKCERCGYDKVQILQAHHKDRNTKNNTLNNLELLCPNCHMEEHHLAKG